MPQYHVRRQGRGYRAGELIADTTHPVKGWRLTEKQGAIAEAALADPTRTVEDIMEITDSSLWTVAFTLEWATIADLADMVLARHGYDPVGVCEAAERHGDDRAMDEMYGETFPALVAASSL